MPTIPTSRHLQPPVTLAPVRRGEGGGEGSPTPWSDDFHISMKVPGDPDALRASNFRRPPPKTENTVNPEVVPC